LAPSTPIPGTISAWRNEAGRGFAMIDGAQGHFSHWAVDVQALDLRIST